MSPQEMNANDAVRKEIEWCVEALEAATHALYNAQAVVLERRIKLAKAINLRAHVNALRDSLECCFALQGCDEPDCPDGGCVAARNRESVLAATPAQSLADVQARARAEALEDAVALCDEMECKWLEWGPPASPARARIAGHLGKAIRALAAESKP